MVQASHAPPGCGGPHDFLGNSANTVLIRQAKGEQGQAPVPTSTLETNKPFWTINVRHNQLNKNKISGKYKPRYILTSKYPPCSRKF